MSTCRIPLRNRKSEIVGHALVSECDYENLSAHRWRLTSHGYARRREGTHVVYMHREILGLAEGDRLEADHINHDTLDNRRENLRAVTHAENTANRKMNARNRSGVRGVYLDEKRGKWCAQTAVGGKTRSLGRFDTLGEAAQAAVSFCPRV